MTKFVTSLFFLVLFSVTLAQAQVRASGTSSGGSRMSYVTGKSGVLLDLALHYAQSESVGTPATQDFKNNTSVYDTKLGYIYDNDFYIGALYSVKNYSTLAGTTNGKTGGLGLGYFFRNNFNVRTFYRHNEVYGEYKMGSGFQADLEYKVSFSSNFYIGALISHRQIAFKKNEAIASFDKYTIKETYPALSLGFLIN